MKYQTCKIDKDYKSIYLYLKKNGFSENFISNLRKEWGNFVVNNEIVNIRHSLFTGDELKINSNPNQHTAIMHCVIPLDIVYEDEYYLLINKPSGLPCMPSRSHYSQNLAGAMCNYMKNKDDNFVLRMINRLDKDTAGIIIIAKDSISQNRIRDIEKVYYAVCEGVIDKSLTIDSPIKTINIEGKNEHKRVIAHDGKEATTFVIPIKTNKEFSLISAKLIHGRTHQIRLHLSSVRHALIGDTLYGRESSLLDHAALVCKEVSFYHPYLNKILKFEVDFPKDFESLLETLKLKN